MLVVKKHLLNALAFIGLCTSYNSYTHFWPSNSRNDPLPVHSAWDPHYFLYEREKQLMFGVPDEKGTPEHVMVSLSVFGQNATKAKTLAGTYCKGRPTNPCDVCSNPVIQANPSLEGADFCMNDIELGDIDGRWNLLGLLAGPLPQGATTPPPLLMEAFTQIFPNVEPGTITTENISFADTSCEPRFGYVSAPLKYRKRGLRWNVETKICGDFGLQLLGGIVEISQVLNPCFVNLNSTPTTTTGTLCQSPAGTDQTIIDANKINCALYNQLVPLAKQLGIDLCNFTKWGIEDLYFSLFWRHAHVINYNRDLSWARFLLIPFIRIGGSFATGAPRDPSIAFSLPFGNNGSHSVNFNAGLNFDFAETVEIGGEIGYSHFFKKEFDNFRMPTNVLQSGIFPYATNVSVQPGDSAYVAAKLAAYHFLDRLSFWGQWVYVHHRKDSFTLLSNDPAFLPIDDNNPRGKCNNTAWRAQIGNFGLTYDLSPNLGIGVLWQQMFHARNTYNATTIMFTLNMIF